MPLKRDEQFGKLEKDLQVLTSGANKEEKNIHEKTKGIQIAQQRLIIIGIPWKGIW